MFPGQLDPDANFTARHHGQMQLRSLGGQNPSDVAAMKTWLAKLADGGNIQKVHALSPLRWPAARFRVQPYCVLLPRQRPLHFQSMACSAWPTCGVR